MVPDGWRLAPIKDVCESIIDCVNKTAPVVEGPTPYKMIRTTNVRNGQVDTFDVRYVAKDIYEVWIRRGAPKVGDLILTREAPVGEVGILEDAAGVFLGQRTVMYRVNSEVCDNWFLLYSLLSAFCQNQISNLSHGGTVSHMKVPDCGEIVVRLPPLAQQKRIASIVRTFDLALIKLANLIAATGRQKSGLMQQLLTGKRRLPGFSTDWSKRKLQDVGTFAKGQGLPKKQVVDRGEYPCVLYGELYTRYPEVIEEVFSRTNTDGGVESVAGDVLIPASTTTTGIDLANATALNESGVRLGGDINILRPNKELIDSNYLAYLLTHAKKRDLARLAQGSTIVHLYGKDIKKVLVSLPEKSEQVAIANVIRACDKEIRGLELMNEQLQNMKKAVMQQLLSGKRRVKVDKEAA